MSFYKAVEPAYVNKHYELPRLSQQRFEGERVFFNDYITYGKSHEEKQPLEFTCFTRTVSPAIINGRNIVRNGEDLNHYYYSMLAIGKFVEDAPNSRDEFKSLDDWNNGINKYSLRRFGYIPNNPRHSLMLAAEIYFSPSKVYQCFGIKAEAMIAAYWRFKDDPYWGPLIRPIITYCVDMYHEHKGSDNYKAARYLFELAFAFNYFVKVNDEVKAGIPIASTPARTLRYTKVQEFGVYRINARFTVPQTDPLFCLYAMPRCTTDIPFNPSTMFYIPYASDVGDKSTFCFDKTMQYILGKRDMNFFLSDYVRMFSYMEECLVSGEAKPAQPQYLSFKNMDEAQKFVDSVNGFERLVYKPDIYFCLKVDMGTNEFKAVVIKKQYDQTIKVSNVSTEQKCNDDSAKSKCDNDNSAKPDSAEPDSDKSKCNDDNDELKGAESKCDNDSTEPVKMKTEDINVNEEAPKSENKTESSA